MDGKDQLIAELQKQLEEMRKQLEAKDKQLEEMRKLNEELLLRIAKLEKKSNSSKPRDFQSNHQDGAKGRW